MTDKRRKPGSGVGEAERARAARSEEPAARGEHRTVAERSVPVAPEPQSATMQNRFFNV